MYLHQALTEQFDEVCDLYGRQLLSIVYKEAWVDVMKIVHKNPPVIPIHKLANEKHIVVRFMADERGFWSATIRPKFKGVNAKILTAKILTAKILTAKILTAKTYEDCESMAREHIEHMDIRKVLRAEEN